MENEEKMSYYVNMSQPIELAIISGALTDCDLFDQYIQWVPGQSVTQTRNEEVRAEIV